MLESKIISDLQKITSDDFNDIPYTDRQILRDLLVRITERGFMSIEDLYANPIISTASNGPHATSSGSGESNFNLIPSTLNQPASCAQVIVAITKRHLKGYNMGRVLRLVRENLIECGLGPQSLLNRTLFIFTDYLDRRALYESRLDMQQHSLQGGLRYALLVWDGQSWRREYF
jgi:hypothetical protein